VGIRGPAKRPTYLKVLSGTAPLDAPPDAPPVAQDRALTALPAPPDWLPNEVARQEWQKVGAALVDRGMVDDTRLMTLGIYCALTGRITQKFQAGETPAAHLVAQHSKLAKELGILGAPKGTDDTPSPASSSRLARLKERAERGN
jgi:phage terminase small subunit